MKNTKIYNVIEYLSATLILSYFFFHNIFLVLIGIVFTLYIINMNFINSIIRTFTKIFVVKKSYKELNKNDTVIKCDPRSIKTNKEYSKLTLAEVIEEKGFIPSIDNNNDTNAA